MGGPAQRTVRTSSTAAWTAFSTWALVAAASVIGFGGHELVARYRYRIRVGRRIGSAALIADGRHARTDGLTSLVLLIGAGGSPSGSAWPTRSSAWSQPSPSSPCSAKLPGRSSPGSRTPSTRHSSTGWRRSLGPPRASSTLARCGCGGSAMPCGPSATSSSTSTCRWCKPTDRRRDRAPAPTQATPSRTTSCPPPPGYGQLNRLGPVRRSTPVGCGAGLGLGQGEDRKDCANSDGCGSSGVTGPEGGMIG